MTHSMSQLYWFSAAWTIRYLNANTVFTLIIHLTQAVLLADPTAVWTATSVPGRETSKPGSGQHRYSGFAGKSGFSRTELLPLPPPGDSPQLPAPWLLHPPPLLWVSLLLGGGGVVIALCSPLSAWGRNIQDFQG